MTKSIKTLLLAASVGIGMPATIAATANTALAAQPMEVYAQLPRMQSVRVSPDGTKLAYVGPYKDGTGLFVYNLADPSAKAFVIPTPDESRVYGVVWGGNNNLLYQATFNRKGEGKLRKYGYRYTRWISTNIQTRQSQILLKDRIFSDAHVTGSRTASPRSSA